MRRVKTKAASKRDTDVRRTLKQRFGALLVVVWLCAWGLIKLGIVTENQILVFLRLADKPASSAEVSVHFVDVGQGDCELIISSGEAILIDCGEYDQSRKVCAYLRAQNITEIKCFIISHQHTDHMGGAAEIIESFDVGSIIMPEIPDELVPTNSTYERFLDTAEEYGCRVVAVKGGDISSYSFSDCMIDIYAQPQNSDYSSLNDYSLCVKASHGDNSFLFAGDASFDEEKQLVGSGFDMSAKVMKVNHHGSSGSNGYDFLKAVGARYAVIGVGAGNEYGHPGAEAMGRIEKYCEYIYRTDLNGTVVFESDGEGLNILTERE